MISVTLSNVSLWMLIGHVIEIEVVVYFPLLGSSSFIGAIDPILWHLCVWQWLCRDIIWHWLQINKQLPITSSESLDFNSLRFRDRPVTQVHALSWQGHVPRTQERVVWIDVMMLVRAAGSHFVLELACFPWDPRPRCQPCSQSLSGAGEAARGATSHLPPHIWSSLPVLPHYPLTASPATHWQLTAQGRAFNHSTNFNWNHYSSHGHVLLLSSPAPGELFPVWVPAGENLWSCGLWSSLGPWLLQCRQQSVSHLVCGLLLLLPQLHPGGRKRTRRLGSLHLQRPWSTSAYPQDPDCALRQILHGHLRHKEVKVQVSREKARDRQREGEAEDEGSDQGSPSRQVIPPPLSGACWTDPDQDRHAAPHHALHLLPVSSAGPQWGGAGAEEIPGLHGAATNPLPVPGTANRQLQSTGIKL